MTDSTRATTAAPMEGGGGYNRNSRVQASGLLPAVALLELAARVVKLAPSPEPVVLADYGSSQGHNSLVPMTAAIAELRARVGSERAISVVHADLPGNDFASLFRTLADDPDSYLRNDPAAFASAVGRSFYGPILPPESVTLGWSSWAVQWLSRTPTEIPDQVQVAYSQCRDVRVAYSKQAAEDWRVFLEARGRELRPGGRLIVLTMATDDDGEFGYRPLLDHLYDALRDMVREGSLRDDEVRRMVIPTVGRARAEFTAPFEADGRCAGLSIEELEIFDAEDMIWAAYRDGGDTCSFGAKWAAFSRASVFPTLAAGLDGVRGDPRYQSFLDRLEAEVAAKLASSPRQIRIPLARMSFVKKGS